MLDVKKALRKEKRRDSKGRSCILFVFNCLDCNAEIFKTASAARISKGRCFKCDRKFIKPRNFIEHLCKICQRVRPIKHFMIRKESGLPRHECEDCREIHKKYKINALEYESLFESQSGKCAICNSTFSHNHQNGRPTKLAVDHCHETGRIRGLLCSKCNLGIGCFLDDSKLLAAAINYLNNNKE